MKTLEKQKKTMDANYAAAEAKYVKINTARERLA
jgi:hypothetical protein